MSKEAMDGWGQSPICTASHDPQEIRRSPFRAQRSRSQNRSPCKRGFLGVGGGKIARNQPALRRAQNRPSLAQEAKTSLKRRGSRVWGAVERTPFSRPYAVNL